MVSICRDAWYYLGVVHTHEVVCEEWVKGVLVEGGFCYILGQATVCYEDDEPLCNNMYLIFKYDVSRRTGRSPVLKCYSDGRWLFSSFKMLFGRQVGVSEKWRPKMIFFFLLEMFFHSLEESRE